MVLFVQDTLTSVENIGALIGRAGEVSRPSNVIINKIAIIDTTVIGNRNVASLAGLLVNSIVYDTYVDNTTSYDGVTNTRVNVMGLVHNNTDPINIAGFIGAIERCYILYSYANTAINSNFYTFISVPQNYVNGILLGHSFIASTTSSVIQNNYALGTFLSTVLSASSFIGTTNSTNINNNYTAIDHQFTDNRVRFIRSRTGGTIPEYLNFEASTFLASSSFSTSNEDTFETLSTTNIKRVCTSGDIASAIANANSASPAANVCALGDAFSYNTTANTRYPRLRLGARAIVDGYDFAADTTGTTSLTLSSTVSNIINGSSSTFASLQIAGRLFTALQRGPLPNLNDGVIYRITNDTGSLLGP